MTSGLVTAAAQGSAIVTASFGGASATASINVTTGQPLPPDPASIAPPIDLTKITTVYESTRFLYEGTPRIQTGVAPGTIERVRAAVLRGPLQTREGAPLPAVLVTISGHPEFGSTLSRSDGYYDLAVNGGGFLTLHFEKSGYVPVDRSIDVPWNRFTTVAPVVMIPYDAAATVVTFGAPLAQVARGSAITDEAGARQATLVFQPGTMATLALPGGGMQPLALGTIRATEFTVGPAGPQAMPAALPPQSGYTYCVELSADEAIAAGGASISFDKPAALYVENFLNFPAGSPVPTGYYDRACGKWVAMPDGAVVTIVAILDGRAYLDIDGDGMADDSDTLIGTSIAEREQLATLYTVGQQLWRVAIPHFTAWDNNWPFGPPDDATEPPATDPPTAESPSKCNVTAKGSIIECEAQGLGESLPIAGTPFTLNYNSTRVLGRTASRAMHIVLSDDNLAPSTKRIELTVSVAGVESKLTFPPAKNQTYDYQWDQRDVYGREIQGTADVNVAVSYVFDGGYFNPTLYSHTIGNFSKFDASGASQIAGDRVTREITVTRDWGSREVSTPPGAWDALGAGFGAWTIDAQQFYDHSTKTVLAGDGTRRATLPGTLTISTVSAGGVSASTKHSVTSLKAKFGLQSLSTQVGPSNPTCIKTDAAGNVYVGGDGRVWLMGRDGSSTVIAGDGSGTFNGDAIPATAAGITPIDLAIAPDGTLYIADEANRRVLRVNSGFITTVAGNGQPGLGDTDTDAADSPLTPHGLTIAADGTLYAADRENNVIRAIDPCSGTMWTVAGEGVPAAQSLRRASKARSPLHPQATPGTFAQPSSLAMLSDGSLLISIKGNEIDRISPQGVVTQIRPPENACVGYSCFSIEPGALLAVGPTLYFTDPGKHTVNAIVGAAPEKIIAGNPSSPGYQGDGGFAAAASLDSPTSLMMTGDGTLYVLDTGNQTIRAIQNPFPGLGDSETAVASSDGSTSFVFDQDGRHVRTVDTLFGVTRYSFGYNAAGYLTSITDVDGNVTTIERNGSAATTVVAAGGQRTQFGYNVDGYLSSMTDPAGQTFALGYGAFGLLTAMTDPAGHLYRFGYDAFGRLTGDSDAAGGFKTLTRAGTANHYVVGVRTAEGRTSTHQVDQNDDGSEVRTLTDPDGLITTISTAPDGEVTTSTTDGTTSKTLTAPDPRFGIQANFPASTTISVPGLSQLAVSQSRSFTVSLDPSQPVTSAAAAFTLNGRTFASGFDGRSRTAMQTSPAGRTVTSRYDPKGHLVDMEIPGIAPVTVTYASNGLATSIAQLNRSTAFGYDPQRRLRSMTDALSRTTLFDYDAADRVTTETMPDGRQVLFSYDANGNLTSLTPPSRPSHTFTSTPVDLVSTYAPPPVTPGGTTLYSYNRDGQLTRVDRPDGRNLQFMYDSAGRNSSLGIGRGTFGYGWEAGTGHLTSITAPDGGSITYNYSGSLPASATWAGTVSGSVSWDYDSQFNLQLESVGCATSSNLACQTVFFGYDDDEYLNAAGPLTVDTDPGNGLVRDTQVGQASDLWSYNEFGEPMAYTATVSGTPILSEQYTRDAVGRITARSEASGGTTTTFGYQYDASGRLTDVTTNGTPTAHYSYDENGNRLTGQTVAGTEPATVDAQDRLLTYGDARYTYTADGELATKIDGTGTTTYDYDELGNLLDVSLPNGHRIDYVIDAQNRRIGKEIDGTLVQRFLYGAALGPAAELDANGDVVARYIYATHVNVPDVIIKGDTTYRVITDLLGSPRLVVNSDTGQVLETVTYDEFGNVVSDSNPGFQPFGFAGGLYDADTSLVRLGARDYDPHTGKWTTKDPAVLGGGPNLYEYAPSDPLNLIDSDGRIPVPLVTGLIGAGASAVGNIGSQLWSNRHAGFAGAFKCIKWGDVGIATATGFVAGLAAPYTAITWIGALGTSALANEVQYSATELSHGNSPQLGGALWSVGTGAVGGAIGGKFVHSSAGYNTASAITSQEQRAVFQRLNDDVTTQAQTGASNLARNLGGNSVTGAPPPGSSGDCGCH